MRDSLRTILFAALLGLLCSGLLVGATVITAPYREANQRAEEVRNFASALGIDLAAYPDAAGLIAAFERQVTVRTLGGLDLYEYTPEGAGGPVAVAVPFSGAGLWGPVRGVLALEPDLLSIRAVRFYEQEETPGLGGEIGAVWFRDQFVGKSIVSADGKPGFSIVKAGREAGINAVEGITGATMTSDRVAVMLDELTRRIYQQRGAYVR